MNASACISVPIERKRLHGYTQAMSAALQQARKMIADSGYTDAARFVPRTTSKTVAKLEAFIDGDTKMASWPRAIKESIAKCNTKQCKFAILVAQGWTQLDAYLTAYQYVRGNTDAQKATACDIAANAYVAELIALLREWISTRWFADTESVKEYGMSKVYDLAESATKEETQLQAATVLLKAAGAFVNRSEITHIHEQGSSGIESSIGALLGAAMAAAVPSLPGLDVIDIQPDSPIGDSISLSIAPSTTE